MDYSSLIASAAQQFGVPTDLAMKLVGAESSGNPNAVSPKGATGLTQLMPGTARDMGVSDPLDPAQNIMGGMRYLGGLIQKYGDVPTALTAYNWGPGNVDKHGVAAAPPETKAYVSKLTGGNVQPQNDPYLQALQGAAQAAPAAAPQTAPAPAQPDPYLQALQTAPSKASPSQAATPAVAAPSANGGAGSFSDFGNAVVHNVMKPLHGAAQFVENAVAKGAGMVPDNPVSRAIINTANQDNAAQQQWEQQYQGSVPNNPASYAGATVGSVAPLLIGGVAKGLQSAGDAVASVLPKATPALIPKIVSGATQGAIVAGATPVDNGQPYWQQKGQQVKSGAIVGGAIPVVSGAVSGAVNAVRNAAAPIVAPQSVVRGALEKWGVTPESLANAPELVPGSAPTTAQIAANPDIVAAEKALANNPAYKPQFDARNIANNDARWSVVNNVAQTPQALADAIKARSDATTPLRQALLDNGKPVPVAPVLDQLDSLAKSPLGQRPAVGQAAQDIASQIRNFATTDAQGNVTIPPAHLDVIRQNVKDFLAKYAPNGAVGTQQQAAFEPVRTSIVDAIEGANPGYRDYLAKYAQLSQPINTMEAAQSIVDNLGNRAPNASGAPQLTLTGLNGQIKKATSTQYGISPEAESALGNVQSDLQRSAISNSVRTPGSDTSYNLQAPGMLGRALYGSNFQGGNLMSILGGLMGGGIGLHTGGIYGLGTGAAAGAMGGKKLANFAAQRVNDALSEALLNPQVAQGLLTQSQQTGSPVMQGLLSHIPQAGLLFGEAALNRQGVRQ